MKLLNFPSNRTTLTNPTQLPDEAVSYKAAFAFRNFDVPQGTEAPNRLSPSFGGNQVPQPQHFSDARGQLEHLPHNRIHNEIGNGILSISNTCSANWMGDANCAGRDPIFWLHHTNIDRLWTDWLALGEGRANSTDENWKNTKFSFYNEKGQLETRPVSDFLETKAFAETMNVPRQQSVDIHGTRANVSIPLPLTKNQLSTAAFGAEKSPSPVLILEGVTYDPGAPTYNVYINLPAGVEADTRTPYYVGSIVLFASPQNTTLKFDLSDKIQSLLEREEISEGQLSVQFVPEKEKSLQALIAEDKPIAGIRVQQVKFALE